MAVATRTILQLIRSTYRKLGIYASGEAIGADDINDGLLSFQDMIAEWALEGLLVPSVIQESFPLVDGQIVYTIGENTADIATARPQQIITAFVREGTTDYPVRIINERGYSALTDKSNGGSRPEYLWYNPTAPNGTISIYRAPSGTYTMYITSLKAFTDSAGLTDDAFADIGIPREYHNPIIYNLAVQLAPENGIAVSDLSIVAPLAESGKSKIKSLTAASRVQPAQIEFAGRYGINDDLVRYY